MTEPTCTRAVRAAFDDFIARFRLEEAGDHCTLFTPFFLPDNTQLTVYAAMRPDGTVEFSDFGETLDWLFMVGMDVDSDDPRVVAAGRRFGISTDGAELSTVIDPAGLSRSMAGSPVGDLVQAVFDVAYLHYLHQPRRVSALNAEVEAYMAARGVPFERRREVSGRTGTRTFDYFAPAAAQPVLFDILSTTTKQGAQDQTARMIFKTVDTRDEGGRGARYLCLVDDSTAERRNAVTPSTLQSLGGYVDDVVFWTDRHQLDRLFQQAA